MFCLIEKNELVDLIAAWHRVMELGLSYEKFNENAQKEVEKNYAKIEYAQ